MIHEQSLWLSIDPLLYRRQYYEKGYQTGQKRSVYAFPTQWITCITHNSKSRWVKLYLRSDENVKWVQYLALSNAEDARLFCSHLGRQLEILPSSHSEYTWIRTLSLLGIAAYIYYLVNLYFHNTYIKNGYDTGKFSSPVTWLDYLIKGVRDIADIHKIESTYIIFAFPLFFLLNHIIQRLIDPAIITKYTHLRH
jgi:hypothetical protein